MTEFRVVTACGTEKDGLSSRSEAEEGIETHCEFCDTCTPDSNHVIEPVQKADGGTAVVEPEQAPPQEAVEQLPDEKPDVDKDPVDWMPDHFVDDIQGTPTVNRKGYAVIAAQYGVQVKAEPVTLPSETDFQYAEFEATAITQDGDVYSGFGSAHVDRGDGDDAHLLGELAETRAMKRATSWATGVGMTAASEMMGDFE